MSDETMAELMSRVTGERIDAAQVSRVRNAYKACKGRHGEDAYRLAMSLCTAFAETGHSPAEALAAFKAASDMIESTLKAREAN